MFWVKVRAMVFNEAFNNNSAISWRPVLLVEETGIPGEIHWPAASQWQTLSDNVVSSTLLHEQVWCLVYIYILFWRREILRNAETLEEDDNRKGARRYIYLYLISLSISFLSKMCENNSYMQCSFSWPNVGWNVIIVK